MSLQESDAIKMYHNTKKGYWGKSKMLKKYGEMLNKVYALQRHREINSKMKKKLFKREGAIRPLFSVQIDLADLPKLQNPFNKEYRYLMVCVDVFSRYMWIKPLKTRQDLHVAFGELLKDMKRDFKATPRNMTADNEFRSRKLDALAKKYKFRWWYGDREEKFRTGIVERAIRTIKNLIKRYLAQNDTTMYIDVLQDLVDNYNDTEHSHIRTKPNVAMKTGHSFPKPMKKDIPILRVGDMVRVLAKRRRNFDKGDKPYYSKELYQVVRKNVNKYVVRNIATGVTSKKTYYIHQLLHVKGVIKNKKKIPHGPGYDKGIEHKSKQRKNQRALKGIDINNIIDLTEREEARRNLHYNDEEVFHDKPMPAKMSDKKLEQKQKQLEKKVANTDVVHRNFEKEIKDLQNQIKNNKRRRMYVVRVRRKIAKLRELKSIQDKRKKQKQLKPLRRGKRIRKKVKRYGYDK